MSSFVFCACVHFAAQSPSSCSWAAILCVLIHFTHNCFSDAKMHVHVSFIDEGMTGKIQLIVEALASELSRLTMYIPVVSRPICTTPV